MCRNIDSMKIKEVKGVEGFEGCDLGGKDRDRESCWAVELLKEMCEWWLEKSRIQKRRSRARNNERTKVDEDVANEPKRKDSEEVLPREEDVRTEKDMLHDLILHHLSRLFPLPTPSLPTPSLPTPPFPPNQILPSPS